MPQTPYTYTTPSKVARFLQVADYTGSMLSFVEDLIRRAEDHINTQTGNSWKLTQTPNFENHDFDLAYEYDAGVPVYLRHRNILQLSASFGDKLEIYDGSAYDDWLANKIEGRNKDYWLNYEDGILYIVSRRFNKKDAIKLKYRYNSGARTQINDANGITSGDTIITADSTDGFPADGIMRIDSEEIFYSGKTASTFTSCTRGANGTTATIHADDAVITWVPEDIAMAATLWCAIQIVTNEDKTVQIAETGASLQETHSARLDRWQKTLESIILARKEFKGLH